MQFRRIIDYLAREPVLLGAAVLATVQAAWDPSAAVMVALGGWVAWGQRLASKSKRTAAEDVEAARYVGAVEAEARGNGGPGEPP